MTANAGYHAYSTGDVLTAGQVQYNLQNQTVMYFATTTARDAALTGSILVEGMVSYVPSTGLMYYNGTAWTAVSGATPLTTKGDIFGYSTINARIPVGTNGKILTADSTVATGVSWANGGLTLITTQSYSGATTINVNNCFTSTYKNYRVIMNNTNTTATVDYVNFRLRSAGVDASTNYKFNGQRWFSSNTTPQLPSGNPTDNFSLSGSSVLLKGFFEILDPANAVFTGFYSNTTSNNTSGATGDSVSCWTGGEHCTASAYDGFTIFSTSAASTGNLSVYGYNN